VRINGRPMAKRTANTGAAAIPPRTFGAAPTVTEVCGLLWELCGPHPPAGYAPPWDGFARDLRGELRAALAPGDALGVAAPAARLGYAACARALLRGAPAVHRVLTEIRGLALAAEPAPEPPKIAEAAPGTPLVYEFLAY
jgi:hypothetical protein